MIGTSTMPHLAETRDDVRQLAKRLDLQVDQVTDPNETLYVSRVRICVASRAARRRSRAIRRLGMSSLHGATGISCAARPAPRPTGRFPGHPTPHVDRQCGTAHIGASTR